jgi:inorganic pyrophosphatase
MNIEMMVVEVPKGSRNKYQVDHESGAVWLDRELFTATRYPVDYGFVLGTLAEDGDPLDALVVTTEPTFPSCHMWCHPTVRLIAL